MRLTAPSDQSANAPTSEGGRDATLVPARQTGFARPSAWSATIAAMPDWPKRLLLAAILGAPIGALAAAATAWWALSSVETGVEPIAGTLHVREGVPFVAATDRAFGLRFVQLERLPHPLANDPLDLPAVPAWAEPWTPAPAPGKWQVGTLAVGWPWPAVARQWSETEPGRGFLPLVELDDDGSTIRRAAQRMTASAPDSRVAVLGVGLLGNLLTHGAAATALIALVLLRR